MKLSNCLPALLGAGLFAVAATASGGDFKTDIKTQAYSAERNLAVDIGAPGAVRADVQIHGGDLREKLRFELGTNENGRIAGGIYIPPGDERFVSVVAFDARGEAILSGESVVHVGKELIPEFQVALEGRETKTPVKARFGSQLLSAGIVGGNEELLKIQLTLRDPYGEFVPYSPEHFIWDLPKGFPEIKYSCFNGALCILEWRPTKEQEAIYLCLQIEPQPCVTINEDDFRGPYKYVAVGFQHTCAITKDDDVRCWGDNLVGQLGAPSGSTCRFNDCSLTPLPVVCPPGEVCKFRSLAAGGNHTCAVDTNSKAWCWGEDGPATGESSNGSLPKHAHRQIPAPANLGMRVDFVSIDTNITHTCALSAAQDVFCWGFNFLGELGIPMDEETVTAKARLVRTGNKYTSIATGTQHSCAIQTHGLMDCWGDNHNFQLTGNVNNAAIITVNPKVPLLNGKSVRRVATGQSTTCVESSDNNTLCWGKPAMSAAATTRNPGFIALPASFATSLATEMDDCGGGFQNCTQTCLTDSSGELMCGRWVTGAAPAQLSRVRKPWTDYGVDWTQTDVGPSHTCTVTEMRDIWCFGLNDFGQFGNGTVSSTDTWEPKTATLRN